MTTKSPEMMDRWVFICGISGENGWNSITAARDEDGIGVVASWSLTPWGWQLTGWGCTEDHGGQDQDGAEPLPDSPPILP